MYTFVVSISPYTLKLTLKLLFLLLDIVEGPSIYYSIDLIVVLLVYECC